MSERVLGDLADLTVGHVGPMATEYVESGIPFLRSLNIRPFRIDLDGVKYISNAFHERLGKSALKPGDVVVVRTGAPGTAAVVPASLPVANCSDVVIVRPGPDLDARYLAYLINSVARGYIDSRTVGAVQQHFNVGAAKGIPIPAATLDEQRRIATALGALDDLIESNSGAAQRLTALARTLYDRAVEPVVATTPFSETVEVISGGTPKTSVPEYWGGDIPWYSVVDAPSDGSPWVLGTSKTITSEGLEDSPARLLPERTTIISARGTVGKLAFVGVPMAMNQSCYGLRSLVGASGIFTFFATQDIVTALRRGAHGSVFDTITRDSLARVSIRVPSPSVISRLEAQAAPLLDLVRELSLETINLTRTREELLPLLISGKVRVSEGMAVA